MELLYPFVNWMNENAWIGMVIAFFLLIHTGLKAFHDGLVKFRLENDKTPDTDDNAFEKFCTNFGKVMKVLGYAAKYLAGFRANAKK